MRRENANDTIDLLQLAKVLWHRAWAIALALIFGAGLAFAYTLFMITPLYQASALMYVNNSDISVGNTKVSITSSDISAAQSLVDTYVIIMSARPTLEEVIEETGVSYTYEELREMVSASAVNGTEIFQIVVTSPNAKEAALLANTIATVLPDNIASIIEGCSVRIVENAVVSTIPVSPNVTKNTAMGGLIAVVLCCAVLIVIELLNDKINDEDDLRQVSDLPILAGIPELMGAKSMGGYYGYEQRKKSQGTGKRSKA